MIKIYILRAVAAVGAIMIGTSAMAAAKIGSNQVKTSKKDSRYAGGWSDWFQLCTDDLPSETHITKAVFYLQGDRSCGAWANCRSDSNSPSKVCYSFQLQGYEDRPGQGYSHGNGVIDYEVAPGASFLKPHPGMKPSRHRHPYPRHHQA